jgi:GT2 family glycosyltransferase
MISIVIVNYNSGNLVADCVKSLLDNIDISFEVIVVDNNSSDNSIEILKSVSIDSPNIKIVELKENTGFAKGNNIGVSHSNGEMLHFLNPDIIVNKKLNGHYRLINEQNEDKIYVTTLTDPEGGLRKSKYLIPTLGNYFKRLMKSKNVRYWDIGASLIIKKTVFEKLGKWEERYFMYAEDLDLFYTAHLHGIGVKYLDTQIIHIEKGCSVNVWDNYKRASIVEKSFKSFYKKHKMLYQYFIIRPIQLIYMLFHDFNDFKISSLTFFKTIFK